MMEGMAEEMPYITGKSQRALIAAKIKPMFEVEAKERQIRKPINSVSANLRPQKKHKSSADAAKLFNVSPRLFKVAVKPRTIEKRAERQMATNVANDLTTLNDNKNGENKEISIQCGRRNLTPAWKIELELGNKEDLRKKGEENLRTPTGSRARMTLSENDKVIHNTQKKIAKAAGVSTGQVGMAERSRCKLFSKEMSMDNSKNG